MPPPVYDPKAPRPPVYEGPDGAAKVAPSQFGSKPTDGPEDDDEYQAPPGFVEEDGRSVPFWFTRTGVIVKWSVCLGLLVILGLYLFFGYQHAQRRLRKGLKPLAYHRVCIPPPPLPFAMRRR